MENIEPPGLQFTYEDGKYTVLNILGTPEFTTGEFLCELANIDVLENSLQQLNALFKPAAIKLISEALAEKGGNANPLLSWCATRSKDFLENYSADPKIVLDKHIKFPHSMSLCISELEQLTYTLKFDDGEYHGVYSVNDFVSMFYFEIVELYKDLYTGKTPIKIKHCLNCERFFVVKTRSDVKYCENISPQDYNKTCQEYAARKNYKATLNENEAMALYSNIYTVKQMRAKRHLGDLDCKKDFENFKEQSKEWKESVKNKTKSEKDYIQWLKFVKNNGGKQ
ncbi:hypothetical protein FACS189499_07660 [Clostridia bacterium]|nr:hypothetical protein FACS189499_07660 [Clostridia bacterium]